MNTCECCDHPLQHAIRRALNAAENGVTARVALDCLADDLEQWEEDNDL